MRRAVDSRAPNTIAPEAKRREAMCSLLKGFVAMLLALASAGASAQAPEDTFARTVMALISLRDWREIEKVKPIHWDPLPPAMHDDALLDGNYFSRNGVIDASGRRVSVMATGARTFVTNFYFRNQGTPLGETALLAAFERAGYTLELVRCPIEAVSTASSKWWRLSAAGKPTSHFQSQTRCDGAPCESYALLVDGTLPRKSNVCIAVAASPPPLPRRKPRRRHGTSNWHHCLPH
jgi:hypothetical protein